MRNSIFKYIFIVFVVILIIVACVKVVGNSKKVEEKDLDQTSTSSVIQTDLRLAIAGYDNFNPILSNNKNIQEISKVVFEPLVTLDSNLKLKYCLASEIAKKDDTNYVIKLREGVCFQDGKALKASDVKYTIDVIKSGIKSKYTDNLDAVSVLDLVDDSTLAITLNRRVPFFEYYLTFPIMEEDYFENEEFASSPKTPMAPGTGKFSIEAIEDNKIVLSRNDNYWDKEEIPMVKNIYINLYGTIGDVYNDFKTGNLDVINASTTSLDTYIGTLGHVKMEYKTRFYDFISFNTTSPIFSDSKVRQAISLAVDKDSLVASLGEGYCPSNFSLDMDSWLYDDSLNIEANLDESKKILQENGWEYLNNTWVKKVDGKEQILQFTITVNSNNDIRIRAAENIKEQLANLGILVDIKLVDSNKYVETLNNANYEVIIAGLECGLTPSVETFFGEGNLAKYTNEEVSSILSEVSNTSDEMEIKNKYKRLYEIYLDEAPYFGLYRETDYVVYTQSLTGSIKPNVFNIYQNIEKWYKQ